nr:hypothetical protein [Globicatella sanguinis]
MRYISKLILKIQSPVKEIYNNHAETIIKKLDSTFLLGEMGNRITLELLEKKPEATITHLKQDQPKIFLFKPSKN